MTKIVINFLREFLGYSCIYIIKDTPKIHANFFKQDYLIFYNKNSIKIEN